MGVFDELLGIDEFLHQPVRKLSLGQRMRCDLAAALLHQPRVLFLDEPTIGLDVVAKENVRRFLREIRDLQGVTVILTTHDLGDIEQLCRRVIIIDKGQVHFDGELDELRRRIGHGVRMTVELARADHQRRAGRRDRRACPWSGRRSAAIRHVAEFSRRDVRRRRRHQARGQRLPRARPAPGRAGHRGDRARHLPRSRRPEASA